MKIGVGRALRSLRLRPLAVDFQKPATCPEFASATCTLEGCMTHGTTCHHTFGEFGAGIERSDLQCRRGKLLTLNAPKMGASLSALQSVYMCICIEVQHTCMY